MRPILLLASVVAAVLLQSAFCDSLPGQEKPDPNQKPQEPTITIVKAEFGSGRAKVNCAWQVRKIVQNKKAVTTITTRGLKLKNRSGRFRNEIRITYNINDGEVSTLKIKNGEKINIYDAILKHAKEQEKLTASSDPVPVQIPVTTSIPLPGKITQIRTGKSGKFLICQMEDQSNLFIVDVLKRKVVKQIPVSDGVVFAASENKLLVGLPMINQLQKWDLTTLKREAAVQLDRNVPPKLAVMGASSNGPLALWNDGELKLWDINSMSPLNMQDKLSAGSDRYGVGLAVSADGQTLCGWTTGISGQSFKVMRVKDGFASIQKTDGHSMNERWAMPNPDGSLLLRYGGAAYSYDLKPLPLENFKNQILLPMHDPRFILALKEAEKANYADKGRYSVTICTSADFRPVVTAGVFNVVSGGLSTTRGRLKMDPAIWFLPEQGLIVSIPDGRKSIDVKTFDLKKVLDDEKAPYLFAISRPPAVAKAGEKYEYQIEALTNAKNVTCQLDMGPKGMIVSPTGKVVWSVKELPADGAASVVINMEADNGTSAVHGFTIHVPTETKIRVADAGGAKTGSAGKFNPEIPGNLPAAIQNIIDAEKTGPGKAVSAGITGTQRVLSFDEKYKATCFGGAGRFMILHFADSDEIRILDLTKQQITASIDAPDDALFAANKDNLIVIFPTDRKFESWSLKRGKRTKTSKFTSQADPTVAVMGTSGDGPLAIWGGGEVQLFDPQSLEPIEPNGPRISGQLQYSLEMSVSADGKTFCGWPTKISNQHFSVMRVDDDFTTLSRTPDAHSMNHRWIMPTADGRWFLCFDRNGYKRNLQRVELKSQLPKEKLFPTNDSRFLISYKSTDKGKCQFTLFTSTDLEPIVTAGGFETHVGRGHPGRPCRLKSVPRFSYFPDKSLFAYLPHSNDQVVLRTVDLNKSLAKAKPDYLIVTSSPPPVAFVGDTFSYQLESLSNSDQVSYSIDEAPDGMTINDSGLVNWTVASRPIGGVDSISIHAKTPDGASMKQSFELPIERRLDRKSLARSRSKDFSAVGFAAIDKLRLELPAKVTSATPGLDGRQLVLCQNFLAVLGKDGWTLEELHLLDKDYTKICEREQYYVAISNEPKGVYILDKRTLKIKKSLPLPSRNMIDLVLHPSLPISYVSMRKSFDLPGSRFVMFDEETGKGKENSEWIGNWMVMAPSGKHIFVGLTDTYRKGSRLIMNPTRWHVSPEYGNIDWLMRYQLDRQGNPEIDEIKEGVGANGKGVRISADGKRVTYLSYTGYPKYSKNLSGWDPMDFSNIPNNYATKDVASCQSFVFHPSLPLAASPGSNSVSIYDQESGQLLKDQFKGDSPEFATTEKSLLYFSQNGKHLIVEGAVNGIHYLQKLNLKVDSKKLASANKAFSQSRKAATRKRETTRIPLAKIEALNGGSVDKLDQAAIARSFKDSVMVVRSGSGSGTGFVVGESGYVLTCAHCVSDIDNIELSLVQKSGKVKTFKATLLLEDDERDIALLKINATQKFRPVQLGVGHAVEMGMPVSVIGNPGVGNVILDYTMTEGIVSNAGREIAGVDHIQISAAVNPGNSGGPMFDQFGNVCGMVVLKADIEGASFAIPANVLADFLMSHLAEGKTNYAIQRSWYSADGKGPLVATFLGYSKSNVRLKRKSDGKEFDFELKKLSEPDKTFLRIFAKHNR